MDLYLFYNCINNITEVLETPEDRLTLKHQIMVNDPLVFNFYLKNLNKKPTSIYSGGAAGPAAAAAGPAAAAAEKGASDPKKELAQKKLNKINADEKATKEKKDADEKKAGEDAEKQEDADQAAEIEKAQQDSENASDTDGIQKILKSLARILIGILITLIVPIVPFVMITFYSFKKLGSFFEINMNRL